MNPTRPTRLLLLISLVLLVASSSVAMAQSVRSRTSAVPVAWMPSPTALLRLAPVEPVRRDSLPILAPSASMAAAKVGHGGRKEAVALMVVGAAGIATGLIADESILIIAGAGVGGFGLYLYLR